MHALPSLTAARSGFTHTTPALYLGDVNVDSWRDEEVGHLYLTVSSRGQKIASIVLTSEQAERAFRDALNGGES